MSLKIDICYKLWLQWLNVYTIYVTNIYYIYIYIYIYITCDSIIINCSLLVLIADYIAVMIQLNMLNISVIWSLHLAVYIM